MTLPGRLSCASLILLSAFALGSCREPLELGKPGGTGLETGPIDDSGEPTMCTYYDDADEDSYGDTEKARESPCSEGVPDGLVEVSGDCDDGNPSVNPGAEEICNDGVDDDCNGEADEAGAVGEQTWYPDNDADGYGTEDGAVVSCVQPTDYVDVSGDCDDAEASAFPGNDERCDLGVDNDCDGEVDEDDAVDARTWYRDNDGDGYGDADISEQACLEPSGYIEEPFSGDYDCYDDNAEAYPNLILTEGTWFDVDRGDGSFDYNCDDSEDLRYPDEGACGVDSCKVDTVGFVDETTPACGETGNLIAKCAKASNSDPCEPNTSTLTVQSCR